ncbi:MAG TPA: tetratricopeptide repeat protein, partial [Candidatus Polarisedimenticolia bacterium]|nr:tetratricopeptide repeat protein [Candidatus Polarisedimenticolia bacterium]
MKRREIRGGLILVLLALASTEMGRPCVGAEVAGDQSRRAEAFHLYSMAQQSLLGRDYAEALTLMEQAAAQDDSPGLLLELAQLRFSLNDLDRAAALAERIVAADPKQVEAHKLLGDIYLSRGREGSDPEANLARAVDQLRAALEGDPADEEACRSLAEIYYRTGRLDETAVLLQTFARGRPLDQAMSLLLGKADLRTGRYAEAEAILTGIVARSPGNLEAVDALAALFEYQKKYDESIALYAGLVRHGSATAYLQDRIGSLHLLAGRYRDAIRELEEGQRLDPDDTRGLLALAQAYEGAGDTA